MFKSIIAITATALLSYGSMAVAAKPGKGAQGPTILSVASSGADFTDPQSALDAITDNSSDKRYLVVIAPGVYTLSQPLQMKSFVTVAGADRLSTVLELSAASPAIDGTAAVVNFAEGTTAGLRDIIITNEGVDLVDQAGKSAIGIYVGAGSFPDIINVGIRARGAENIYGMYYASGAFGGKLFDSSISIFSFDAFNSVGIKSEGTEVPQLVDTNILVQFAHNQNRGIEVSDPGTFITMQGGSIETELPSATNGSIVLSGNLSDYVRISFTRLGGGQVFGSANVKCFAVSNLDLDPLDSSCATIP